MSIMSEHKRILIVDDEVDLVYLLQVRLKATGYAVAIARDGEECLHKVKSESPDLILLDVLMPKLNGYEVCRILKNDSQTRHIPVVMLTAAVKEGNEALISEIGADFYLTKPYEMADLLKKIKELIEKEVRAESSC